MCLPTFSSRVYLANLNYLLAATAKTNATVVNHTLLIKRCNLPSQVIVGWTWSLVSGIFTRTLGHVLRLGNELQEQKGGQRRLAAPS
jgi:hypothetical protein